jgi:tetratricopeptide (TPR) repeat protein
LVSRIANAPVAFVTYLEKVFWPHDMAVFYPFSDKLPVWEVLGAILLILIISFVVILMVKRLPYLFVGWLWYSIILLPVIGIIQIGRYAYAMADRYTYLPSIGIAVMLSWGIPYLIKSEKIRKNILFPVGIMFLSIMAILSWKQCIYWKNSAALFSHALQVTKDNAVAYNNLGTALFAEGKIKEAIDHYNETIRLQPDYSEAYNSRGIAYAKSGKYQPAIKDFNEAISLQADYASAYHNRGLAYFAQGNNELGCFDAQKACELGNCKLLEIAKGQGVCR